MPRINSDGWTVLLTHPDSGRTIRPDVIDPQDVQYIPGPNAVPEIRVPIRRGPEWLTEQFDDNPEMTVYLDGEELPIDELVDVEQPENRTLLVGEGGIELRERIQKEFDTRRRHKAAEDVIGELTYAADVSAPSVATQEESVQNPTTGTDFSGLLINTDTYTPLFTQNDKLQTNQSGFFFEAENYDSGAPGSTNSDADASGSQSIKFFDTQHDANFNVTTSYDIPAANVGARVRWKHTSDPDGDGNFEGVGIDIKIDGETIFSRGTVDYGSDAYDWDGGSGKTTDLTAGSYTLSVECTDTSNNGESDIDAVFLYDDRFTYNFDNSVDADNLLGGPELHPDAQIAEFDDFTTIFLILAARNQLTIDDTSGSQFVQVSPDQGANWYPNNGTEENTDSIDVDFTNSTINVRTRVQLSRWEPNGPRNQSPRLGYASQKLDAYELFADIEFASLLIDETYDNDAETILNKIAAEQFVWTYNLDDTGTPTISFAEAGQRVADRDPDLSGSQITKRVKTYDKTTIKGSQVPVSEEQFQASSSFVNLVEDDILNGSEAVYDTSGTQYTRGVDYEINYEAGEIRTISGGALTNGTTYSIDYRHQIKGSYTVDGVSNPTELIKSVSGVVSDRQAEQIAYVLTELEPGLQTPRYEGDIVVPRVDATFDPLEALNLDELDIPDVARPLSIRGTPEITPLGLTLRLGSAPPLESSLAAIREQVSSISDRV